jgi:hypothetical protein
MRVQLVVTGDVENKALGRSLERVLSGSSNVSFDRPLLVSDGAMTPNRLRDPSSSAEIPEPVRKMARALVTQTWFPRSKRDGLPDLVVGIDDLELANVHQPHVVIAWLRKAVQQHVTERFSAQDAVTVREALRARCSFHLLVPLVEAYFFGEQAALARAGVAAEIPVHQLGRDVEEFETDDPQFLPIAQVRNAEKAGAGYSWWREERHPKRYLEFLVERSGGLYVETRGGARALEELDWPKMGADADSLQFARAMFEDLSQALDTPNPLGWGAISSCTYPDKSVRPENLTLRNL